MNLQKILGLVAIAIAIIAAFANVPYVAAVLVVIGLVVGLNVEAENQVRVLVSALVLNALGGALGNIPAVGVTLVTIVAGIATFVSGGALMIIFNNIYNRFKP
jgi:hypothetical protein